MTNGIDVTTEQRRVLLAMLHRLIPDVEVWAYGSRVNWTARPNSDLDLVAFADTAESRSISELKDELTESDLPFLVDLHIWEDIPERFREIIRRNYVVIQKPAASKWSKLPLGELTDNFDSRRIPVKEADRRRGPYPYYGASGIVDRVDEYLFDGEYLLIGEDGENLRTRQTPVAFLANGKFWVNNHAHIVRGNSRADTRFLSYALSQTDISGYLTGSTMPKLTQGNMNRIPVVAPPLAEQKAIAAVLGALDDKIELNRRMNATLEAMARALFQSWFVDFDPVRAKLDGGQPKGLDPATVALFPNEFEGSELGPIPKGWEGAKISDMSSTQYGYTASAAAEPVGPHFLRVMDINKQHWIDWDSVPHCMISAEEKVRYALSLGDIVVARMADPGKSAIVEQSVDAVFASYLVRLKTESLAHAYYLYYYLKSPAYAEYSAGAMSGSVQANMNAKVIVAAGLSIPPVPLMRAFLDKILPLRQRIVANLKESKSLAMIRDALLPKLLSGKLSIAGNDKSDPSNLLPL